jgi:hypothetical protein
MSAEPFPEVTLPAPTRLEALQAQVLELSKADRSRLLDRLLAAVSLEDAMTRPNPGSGVSRAK